MAKFTLTGELFYEAEQGYTLHLTATGVLPGPITVTRTATLEGMPTVAVSGVAMQQLTEQLLTEYARQVPEAQRVG